MNNLTSNNAVLVIGGSGFIGQHLVRRCLEFGANVTTLGLGETGSFNSLGRHINLDILNREAVLGALRYSSFDYVFNLSGYIDHKPFCAGGRDMIDTHFVGLMNIVEALQGTGLKRFVQIGSSDEYGNNPAPQHEAMRENPISPYSTGKTAASHFVQMLARTEQFPAVVLRFFLVFGPGQGHTRFLPQIIKACLRGDEFPASAGMQIRDFCYVEDVVEAMIMSATTEHTTGAVLNIASGIPRSIRSVVEAVQGIIGTGKPCWGKIPYRPGENMELYADITAARELLGWKPRVSFEEGLALTIDYYRGMQ